jgi:NAD(P)-dependent dehydrogenase (short-subunit alcohol dehydrogenase family)
MNYRDADLAERMINEVASADTPGQIIALKADVRNRLEVQEMMTQARNKFGNVDVLINCAGVNRDAPFLDLTDEDWITVVDSHLKGTFICSQEFVRHSVSATGSIINLGAACGIQGRLNGANFCSAKGGVLALTKCMARELAPDFRVNCLTPSAVDTKEVRERYALDTAEGMQKVLSGIPMGRLGARADVIHMVESILGAEFTTGENFFVNGGEFMQ